MRRLFVILLVLCLAAVFAFPASNVEAAKSKAVTKVVKIGDISNFNGAVLIRTKGTWGRLRKVPHPLFSSDKIVTKRGRAQVKFVDGGIMRINIDSNVSIVQRVEMKGFFKKKAVTSREVNVLVGDVWFDVKVTKDRKITFRTPSMTAAIRGTSGQIKILLDKVTSFGLSRGSAETSGDFGDIVAELIREMKVAGIMPKSNAAVQQSPMMQAATKAVAKHSAAAKSNADAGTQSSDARDKGKKATADDPDEVLAAAQVRAIVAVVVAAAAADTANAQVETSKEALLEAQRMGNTEAAAEAQKNLDIAQASLDTAQAQVTQTREVADDVSNETDPAKAAAGAARAVAASAVATASASIAVAVTQVSLAQMSGNVEAIEAAQKQVEATQASVVVAQKQEAVAEKVQETVAADPKTSLAVVLLAAQAISAAAETIASSSVAQANVATQAASGDTASQKAAEEASTQLEQLADAVDAATAGVAGAVADNDVAAVEAIAETTSDAADVASDTINAVIDTSATDAITKKEPTKEPEKEPDTTSPSQ